MKKIRAHKSLLSLTAALAAVLTAVCVAPVWAASNNVIRGNVISGNSLSGVAIQGGTATGNVVASNLIGTDAAGTGPLANAEHGVHIHSGASSNTIGGTTAGARNVVSGNTLHGVFIEGTGTDGNLIQGNFIGVDTTGVAALGNGNDGVNISGDASGNTVGGTVSGAGNTIAFNGKDGVYLAGGGTDANQLLANSIFSNTELGIDLDPNGPGAGGGANNDKAAPTVDIVLPNGLDFDAVTTVSSGDTVEFFRVNNGAAPTASSDGSGSGEGYLFLGRAVDNGASSGPHISLVADADPAPGIVQVTLLATGLSATDTLSATATNADGTSEFASNAIVTLNTPPVVANAIPDTTVTEDSAPVASYRDLNDVFDDAQDGGALNFAIQSNTNPGLVTPTINAADSTLGFAVTPVLSGSATIVIRATDSGALSVDDTLVVTVGPVNDPPTVVAAMPDTTVSEDNAPILAYRDLNDVFDDIEDGNVLSFAVQSNTNPGLVTPTINAADSTLDFAFTPILSGSATVVIRATDSGALSVDDTLVVTVSPVNDPPTVVAAMPDTTVSEDNAPILGYRDLNDVFDDIEDGAALSFAVQSNTNPGLVTPTINAADSTLDFAFTPVLSGSATVVIRATDSGALSVDDTLVVTVSPVNDPPTVVAAMPDTTVSEDNAPILAYRDLNDVFADTEDGSALNFAIQSNTNPGLVTATINAADSTLGFTFGADQSGTATIAIRATDSGALSVDDTVVITVNAVNDAPLVAAAMPDTVVAVDSPAIDDYRDLTSVFSDAEEGGALDFLVQANDNPSLVTAAIDADSLLDLSITPGSSGTANIIIRATDSGALFAEDTLSVTVTTGIFVSASIVGGGSIQPGAPAQKMFRLAINNLTANADTITAIDFTNASTGAGTPAQLDGNFTALTLSGEGGATVLPGGTPGVRTASFTSGILRFDNLVVVVPASSAVALAVAGGATLTARDGDVCDLSIAGAAAIDFNSAVAVASTWPLNPSDSFPVDGMVAAQLTLNPVTSTTMATGSTRQLALDVGLPANGYQADILNRINVVNLGTAFDGTDISAMEAWVDDGDGVFDDALDGSLGTFLFTGSRWEMTGLSTDVPLSAVRVFVTVDIEETANEGRTIRLSLPTLPDIAIGMDSNNSGPLDAAVDNPFVQTITSAERVVLSTPTLAPAVVRPGDAGVLVLDLVANNNYAVPKQITRLTVHNTTATTGAATQADLDSEIDAVVLRIDANDNGVLDDVLADPIVGTATFSAGEATFTGLSWDLPSLTSRRAFLTVDVSNTAARDDDSLSLAIAAVWDVDFSDATSVIATWPLDSDTHLRVDGMLAAQITNLGVPAVTLAPGDGPILALDLVLPGNGYADDVLTGFEVVNLGDADTGDLADIRLWRDGGDGQFSSGGGDDIEISPLVWSAGAWKSTTLSEPLPAAGTRVYVGITVSPAPTDSSSVRLAVPLDGITMVSNNDGPIDVAVESAQSLLLSTAPLLASLSVSPAASTVGAPVTVRMVVRNTGAEQIDAVAPTPLTTSGSAAMTIQSGPVPPSFDLAIAAVDTFTWVYTSSTAGIALWSGGAQGIGAVSSLPRATLDISSGDHSVFQEATTIDMFAIESMPFLIDRNQVDVTPLSLTFSAVNSPDVSNVQIHGLKIRIETGAGAGVVPADLLSRISVSEGNSTYIDRTSLETSGDEIDLTFATPAIVPPSEPVTLSLTMDILPTTVIPEFRITIQDSTWIIADDAISGAPVFVSLQQNQFPVMSGLGRIVSSPTQLDVSGIASPAQRVGQGQSDVDLLTLRMNNPGVAGVTTDVAAASFGVTVVDSNGTAVANPMQIFRRVQVRDSFGTILGDHAWGPADTLALPLSPTANVVVNTPRDVIVSGELSSTAPLGTYRLRLAEPSWFDARDSNTGSAVAAIFQSPPIDGGTTIVEAPADSLFVLGTPELPAVTTLGQPGVRALTANLLHAAPPDVARILIDEVTVRCRNQLRSPLVPDTFIDRVSIVSNSVEIGFLANIPTSGDQMTVPIAAVLLEPGESADLTVYVDISATAPETFLELIIEGSDMRAVDANTGAATAVAAQGGAILPLSSGLTQLLAPPTELLVGLDSKMPAALVPGEQNVVAATVTLENPANAGAGPVTLDHLSIRASDRDFASISLGASAARIKLMRGATLAGQSDTLSVDSTTAYVALSPPIVLQPQESAEIELLLNCHQNIDGSSIRVGIDRSDVGVVQPISAVLQIQVEPTGGQTFPMWTDAGGLNELSLQQSFSNFPNPFAAGGEMTTFVYYLPTNARVSLRIFTGRGKGVATLLSDDWHSAGLYQNALWDGRNGRGNTVVNGVYLAELVVKYENGNSERIVRKVAVVR